ncbi:peptide-methionine (S)-S-oxide reductase MsrA [Sinimarinibacterium thermocellulolyticum]|uniref:Peptide methionine sulfoxide reductase MsrA n=1 Tax=Sinimarinibacterium thermocellulolyticum TaxID=3170016 RepID=A0ABV2ACH3_9GAMM
MTPRTLLLCALTLLAPLAHAAPAVAIFAAGCFWCTEADFEKIDGVIGAESGYIGGRVEAPSYEQVSAGGTGHVEAVRVQFDPERVSYEELLAVYWRNVDPYAADGQFCDKGPQYRSAIFYLDEAQRASAERTRDALAAKYPERPAIVTEILPATRFWPAEAYHQDYYKKNPVRYRYYRWGCGRDRRLAELWGTPS